MPLLQVSDEQARLITEILDWWKHRPLNERRLREVEPDPTAPDVYVALTPGEGIPAIDASPGTGTGSGIYDEPGSRECQIYRLIKTRDLVYTGTGTGIEAAGRDGELRAVPGLVRRIYNLSTSDVTPNIFVPVVRDKFGIWYVAGTSFNVTIGGGGAVGTGTDEGVYVLTDVTFDPLTCSFVTQYGFLSAFINADGTVTLNLQPL